MAHSSVDMRVNRWNRRASRALQHGDLDAAVRACHRALELDANHADSHFIVALCAMKQARYRAAAERFRQATSLDETQAAYWAEFARCLALLGRRAEAIVAADRAAAAGPADASIYDSLGATYTLTGNHREALASFEAATRVLPENPEFLYHLATALMFCGELDRARATFQAVLDVEPQHLLTHLALAENLSGPPPNGRIEQLETTLSQLGGNIDNELVIRQALARTLEAAGQTGRAFQHWDQSKRAKKAAVGYSIEQDRSVFRALENLFSLEATANTPEGASSNAPIFVFGLPRSGTTLTEHLLSSHSLITGCGELSDFPQVVGEAGGLAQAGLFDPASFPGALRQDPESIGERYLELTAPVAGSAERFVDKQPLNFLLAGFIVRSLPNAKLICLRRGALDSCLAIFRHLFAANFRPYYYSLTIEDLAEYFALFTRLMSHWDAVFPGAIYHLQYEDLVSDFDAQARRLFDFLEVEFEPTSTDFSRNQSPVATASAVQVRRPLHQESVGAWRKYQTELEPLRLRLEELGIEPEFSATAEPA